MQYPLDNWTNLPIGFTFKQLYPNTRGWGKLKGQPHLGIDKVCPIGTPVYAPTDGLITSKKTGEVGGLTMWFRDNQGKLWRFLHLSRFANGFQVKEGDLIAYTGNTGSPSARVSYAPHLHVDISNNGELHLNNLSNFIDPEKYLADNVANEDMTNTQFLHALYFGFYNRTPDAEGLQFWLNKMEKENVPAGEVVRGLLSSDEAQKHFKYII